MEHPHLNIKNIKAKLTLEQVEEKLADIMGKLNFAYRTGNQPLINQLNMARETYTQAQNDKLNEMFDDKELGDKINITDK